MEPPPFRLSGRSDFPEQQLHPPPWAFFKPDSARGAEALRSLVACASGRSLDIVARYGTVRKARGASLHRLQLSYAHLDVQPSGSMYCLELAWSQAMLDREIDGIINAVQKA